MKHFWVSWWAEVGTLPAFEWHGPWCVSGYDADDRQSVCAAVMAEDEDAAKEALRQAHDDPPDDLDWRFVTECRVDREPFTDRFPQRDWMRWPWTSKQNAEAKIAGGSNG